MEFCSKCEFIVINDLGNVIFEILWAWYLTDSPIESAFAPLRDWTDHGGSDSDELYAKQNRAFQLER